MSVDTSRVASSNRTTAATASKPSKVAGLATWADELRSSSPEAFKRTAPWHYVKLSEGTCKLDRDRRPCRPAADDQRACRVHRSRSTHSRNGNARNTRAPRIPASSRIAGHSSGRYDRAIDSVPS